MSDDRPAVMVAPISEAQRRLAREAVESMERRKDEDVDAWAARLAADVATLND